MERDGAFYLFTLRLIPAVPFFAVNLLMGLTRMRARTFYLVSQIGMLAGTAAFVNAGTRLAEVESPRGILSAPIILSFGLLAILPWIARGLVKALKRRRAYARWRRPRRFDRNLIVIGAGSAGLVSAYIAAATKAKVTLVEAGKMGGDCLNYGCVPSKALIKAAKIAQTIRATADYGVPSQPGKVSFPAVFGRIDRVIRAIAPHDSRERFQGLGVDVRQGHARLVDPWTVSITAPDGGETRLTARAIILATGAAPFVPPLPGLDQVGYLTSDTLWEHFAEREQAPGRIAILGGGPIGCELGAGLRAAGGVRDRDRDGAAPPDPRG